MEKKVIAIVGCGAIANNGHLPQLSKNPAVRIKYAVDLVPERAEAACRQYGAERAITDYREVLADKEVDAVFVLTPNAQHAPISVDCLAAGKHVLCEKPITVNYELSKKMAEAAKKAGKMLDIGVCNRYNRSVNLIREYIEAGKLGEVYQVFCSFRSYRSIPGIGGDFTTKAVAGGGVLIDWGVHFIDLILYALGLPKVKTVSANHYCKLGKDIPGYTYLSMWSENTRNPSGTYDVDDMVSGFIRTTGANISFMGAWAQNINKDEMFVDFMGDKGGIRLNYGGGFTFYSCEGGVLETVEPHFAMPSHFDAEEKGFFAAIDSGEKSRNNIEYVLETAKILDAIYLSGDRNAEVTL